MTRAYGDNRTLEAMDRHSVLHPFTNLRKFSDGSAPQRVIRTGKGIRIKDESGAEFIDALAGLYCVNVGYGRSEIADAIARQAKELAFYHSYTGYSTEALIRLSDRLVGMAPGTPARVFYGLSGSDANETQVKLVWHYNNILGRPKKKKLIARQRAYHGATVMTGSLTGLALYHEGFDLPAEIVRHTIAPHYWLCALPGETELEFSRRCADELEALILREGPDTVAAFFAEPVLGSGGMVPPPDGYFAAIQEVLSRYDILLIADEVVTGLGRTGAMFASDKYGIKPDLVTLAKGLTSAYAPLSASIVGEKVWEVLLQGSDKYGLFPHGYTYSGHPIGVAAANATLDITIAEDLPGNAARVGERFQSMLRKAFEGHPIVGEVRGVGLMAAIEFVAAKHPRNHFDASLKVGARVAGACFDQGLIARALPQGDILGLTPPLVLTEAEAEEIVGLVKRAVAKVADDLTREGVKVA